MAPFTAEARGTQSVSQALPDLDVLPNASDDHGHMRRDLPAGTVTFLFTDVEGSTKLLHELGAEAYAEALAEHRRVVRDACTARGGVEVDTQGDAFFLAFPTTTAALESARAITEELASGPITLRSGVHTGTPLLTEEGYVGEDVHFAARVAASAHGGQVVLSSATRALLDDGYPLVELGEHRLKDIPEPVVIFQLGGGQFPPLKTISNTNLPRPASSFVGRERELSELLARIEGGGRLLTLTGPGGSGKTRLAIEAAATLVPEYKAGVFWIGLAALRDSALVSETIAQTLGAKDGLAEHIGEREMLLLLDNLEQVMESAPELSSLLQGCRNLTLLVTSRELLRVQGEIEYPVPPLAEAEAVSLFCQRAQTEPSEEIAELCRRLDNLPLAVELAAARTKALSPAQILERLSQRLDLLKGGRDADPRQHTLRATIEWSHDLLSPEEQRLFRALSVFAGGCMLEAAEQVADADLDTLQSLVEKSLLRFSNERYWMLETIREYAAERLEEAGEGESLRRRHAEYLLALTAGARDKPQGSAIVSAAGFRLLEEEQENLRDALAWIEQTGWLEAQLDLLSRIWHYWIVRGGPQEGLRWAESALARCEGEESERRAKTLHAAVGFALRVGDLDAARRYADEGLRIRRQHDDPVAIAVSLSASAAIAVQQADFEEAERLYREAVVLARSGDEHLHAELTGLLGELALGQGNYARAIAANEEALALFRALGRQDGESWALWNLALALSRTGDERGAVANARASLRIAHSVGDMEGLAVGLVLLSSLAMRRAESDVAARLLGAAKGAREEGGVVLDRLAAELYETTEDELRRAHGSIGYEAASEDGKRMPVDTAVELALASVD
jgi:predicted ATPase/class 3 adenylate cyclase